MTWGDLQKMVIESGVKEDTRIDFIDTGVYPEVNEVEVHFDLNRNEFTVC